MYDCMQYDPIQGKRQGHEQMTTDSSIRAQCLQLLGAGFFIFVLVFFVT